MRYCFGDFVIDTSSYSLSRAGQSVQVRPKVFDLLRYLIEQRERVVSKQELLEALWPAQHVDDLGVPWTVSHLRRALGQLKGAQTPIQTTHGRGYRFVAELRTLDAAEVATAPLGNPTLAAVSAVHDPFVGRELLMEQLDTRLARAAAGSGVFCLLSGDPGIGKTRCLDEFAARAEAAGFSIWRGRSIDTSGGPVFWPWVQALRALCDDRRHLAQKARSIVDRLTSASSADPARNASLPANGTESDRYWLYDAVVQLLQGAAHDKPALLMFDDLHWADTGTWDLLAFLAPELKRCALLVVGARREEPRGATRRAGAQLVRDVDRFKLSSLSIADVERYVQLVTGAKQADAALGSALHALSAGNPWFLREALDSLLAEHGPTALETLELHALRPTASASDALQLRVSGLSEEARDVLALASVLGDRFEIDLLARMSGGAVEALLMALEEAQAEGFVQLDPPRHASFCHGLLRQVVYGALSVEQRMRLHIQAALALEHSLDPLHYGQIAFHYHAALPLADAKRAGAAALRAADVAARSLAFHDAATFLDWAAEAQLREAHVTPRLRAELLLSRALMERLAGNEAAARVTASHVIELARQEDAADLLVRAARVLRVTFALGSMPDATALSALEQALRSSAHGLSEARVGALSLLSWLPPYALDMERSKALSAEAAALAQDLASPAGMHEALHARLYALSGPDDIDALLEAAQALMNVPGERPAWVAIEALLASYRAHLYRCDSVAADVALAALGREAARCGISEAAWHHDFFRAQRMFSRGELDASEQLFNTLAERGMRLKLTQAPLLGAVASALLVNEREGMAAVQQVPSLDALLGGLLALPSCYAVTGARLAAECGRHELARRVLYQFSEHDFKALVKDLGYVNALANLSVVSVVLGDRARAAAIYERLLPYPHHNTPSGVVGFFEGAAARFLAGLAAFLEQPAQARRHFDDALALNEQLEALPLVARTCFEYARWLTSRGESDAARSLQRRAIALAEQLGMHGLAGSARKL